MQRGLLVLVAVIFLLVQYRLWIGENSLAERQRLEAEIAAQRLEIDRLKARNEIVEREVRALREGQGELEARAREELGLVKDGETFYLILDEEDQSPAEQSP